ncbi:MAG: hypothetical protein JSS50_00855 [Proteobacteria bacterium]|nr:hypothetical protein [Pseudomonadota bacterium]
MANLVVTTFYKIIDLPEYKDMRAPLIKFCGEQGLRGTILLTPEGVNSTIVGSRQAVDAFYQYAEATPELAGIEYKETYAQQWPFQKMKVLLKAEVVAMKAGPVDMNNRGEYVAGQEWDALINDPNTVVVDTRNNPEIAFGTFRNAINPNTEKFSEFAAWAKDYFKDYERDQPIAMFCTYGIRCEKSTAYMKGLGFTKVYHLHGGIGKYLEETKNRASMWKGSCFVFDDRLALDDNLQPIENAEWA